MPGRIDLDVNIGAPRRAGEREAHSRLRILVLGDLSGRRNRADEHPDEIAQRPSLSVDLDTFDAVMRRLHPRLRIGGTDGGAGCELTLSSLDDFHPDALYRTLDTFRDLRESRARIEDPRSFEQEAAALLAQLPPATIAGTDTVAGARPADDGEPMMERLLGVPAGRAAPRDTATNLVATLVAGVVRPYIVPAPSSPPEIFLAALDAAASERMRALLHDPDLQALEAAWRGLRRMVEALDPDGDLELRILDVSRGELALDLQAADRAEDSGIGRAVSRMSAGATAASVRSLLVALYEFGPESTDLELLERLAAAVARAGAPVIAAAAPELLGCERALIGRSEPASWQLADPALAQRWSALRRSSVARWIGLALPRVLARLPYGARTDAVESFRFEERTGGDEHEALLWGHPALACAEALGRAIRDDEAGFDAAGPFELADLPAFVRDDDGEKTLQACAEHLLPLRTVDEILARGLIAIASFRDRNAVLIPRLQSIADPPAALGGLG